MYSSKVCFSSQFNLFLNPEIKSFLLGGPPYGNLPPQQQQQPAYPPANPFPTPDSTG
jgi:hypothetical protein